MDSQRAVCRTVGKVTVCLAWTGQGPAWHDGSGQRPVWHDGWEGNRGSDVDRARTGVARLMAEMRSVSHKLRHRVRELEKLAAKRHYAAAESALSDDVTAD